MTMVGNAEAHERAVDLYRALIEVVTEGGDNAAGPVEAALWRDAGVGYAAAMGELRSDDRTEVDRVLLDLPELIQELASPSGVEAVRRVLG